MFVLLNPLLHFIVIPFIPILLLHIRLLSVHLILLNLAQLLLLVFQTVLYCSQLVLLVPIVFVKLLGTMLACLLFFAEFVNAGLFLLLFLFVAVLVLTVRIFFRLAVLLYFFQLPLLISNSILNHFKLLLVLFQFATSLISIAMKLRPSNMLDLLSLFSCPQLLLISFFFLN